MAATQGLAALLAAAAVDLELANDGPAGDLGLELLIERVLDDVAAAIGTMLGQRGFHDSVGRRRFAMGVGAVLVASLAARLLRTLLRFAFRERSGLSLGGSFEFFDALLEFADELLQPRVLLAQPLILKKELLIRRRVHAGLGSDNRVSCTRFCRISAILAR